MTSDEAIAVLRTAAPDLRHSAAGFAQISPSSAETITSYAEAIEVVLAALDDLDEPVEPVDV